MNPLYYWNSNIVPPWCGNCNHEMSSFDNHKWYPIYQVNTVAQVFTCLGHLGGLSSSWKDLCDPLYQRLVCSPARTRSFPESPVCSAANADIKWASN